MDMYLRANFVNSLEGHGTGVSGVDTWETIHCFILVLRGFGMHAHHAGNVDENATCKEEGVCYCCMFILGGTLLFGVYFGN